MKKIIAISVMFVLLTGAVFAADIGVTVIGSVDVVKSDTSDETDGKISSTGDMNRIRLSASGTNDDGTFGGWFWTNPGDGWAGYAFWKPIDQLRLLIGSFPDGLYGKEGVTGWSYGQMVTDTNVGGGQGDHVWGGGVLGLNTRQAFFGGYGEGGLMFEITPTEMVAVNIALPVFDGGKPDAKDKFPNEMANVFASAMAQLSLNFDFGNIAITYKGKASYYDYWSPTNDTSVVLAYFGGNFGDISLDVGIGYMLKGEDDWTPPITAGIGLKYSADSFAVKFRAIASLAGKDGNDNSSPTIFFADVLPLFKLSDSMRVGVSVGFGMLMPDEGDSVSAFHFNPFIEIGQEWGPAFYAGLRVEKSGMTDMGGYSAPDPDNDTISWSVPIGLIVSF